VRPVPPDDDEDATPLPGPRHGSKVEPVGDATATARSEPLTPPDPAPSSGTSPFGRPPVLPGIILGRELAKTLGLRLGDPVDVISTKTQDIIVTGPMPRLKEFRVAGVFFSGHYEYDQKYGYVALDVAQEFLRKEGMISGVEVRADSADRAGTVALAIRSKLGRSSPYQVRPWQEIHKAIFSALEAEKIAMFLVLVVIVLVASFSIVANLIMVVAEKTSEIAVLRSMGARPLSVLRIFLWQGLYIGMIGMAFGIGMGIALSMLFRHLALSLDPEIYYIRSLPIAVNPVEVAVVAAAVIGISLLAAVFPAVRAMRLQPVHGLRFK
jgi:lipoprotein-releasing system permease protein